MEIIYILKKKIADGKIYHYWYGNGTVKYRKVGKLVEIIGDISGVVGQYKVIYTMPYKPIVSHNFPILIGSNNIGVASIAASNGNLILLYHNLNGGDFVSSDKSYINFIYFTAD